MDGYAGAFQVTGQLAAWYHRDHKLMVALVRQGVAHAHQGVFGPPYVESGDQVADTYHLRRRVACKSSSSVETVICSTPTVPTPRGPSCEWSVASCVPARAPSSSAPPIAAGSRAGTTQPN